MLGEEESVLFRNVTSSRLLILQWTALYSCTHRQYLEDFAARGEKKKRGDNKLGGDVEAGVEERFRMVNGMDLIKMHVYMYEIDADMK